MKLIVGLGNPGKEYEGTRHNIGFALVRELADTCAATLRREKGIAAYSCKVSMGGTAVLLAIPLTYMNLSGSAVKALLIRHKIQQDALLVVCDDLDIELGRLKIKPSGSSAGHRGIQSIIDAIHSDGFSRLRVGIGRPPGSRDAADYVLSVFGKKEQPAVRASLREACACCQAWVTHGVTQTMNMFNQKERTKKNE